jgi:hypothetical protein
MKYPPTIAISPPNAYSIFQFFPVEIGAIEWRYYIHPSSISPPILPNFECHFLLVEFISIAIG